MKINTKFKQTEIGEIPEDWQTKNLGEIVDVIGGAPFKSKDFTLKGFPVLKIANIKPMKLLLENLEYISKETAFNYQNALLKKQDLLITMTGNRYGGGPDSWVGKVAIFNQDNEYYLNQRIGILRRKNKSEADIGFLAYYLGSMNMQEKFVMIATGAGGQANISPLQIKAQQIPLPTIKEQQQIASILSSLDDKIELNKKIIKNLEQTAQALFKHWFVDFEFPNESGQPYKSSGGEMIDSELGQIPKGWKIDILRKNISFIKGKKPLETSILPINGFIKQILIETLDNGKFCYANPEKMILSETNNPIMVMDGASSGRVEIGYSGIIGSTLSKIEVLKNNNYFIYFLLKMIENDNKTHTTGTSIPHTDKNRILNILIAIPNDNNLLNIFEENGKNIIDKIIQTKKQIEQLIQLRDLLLPKLLSGKIRVI